MENTFIHISNGEWRLHNLWILVPHKSAQPQYLVCTNCQRGALFHLTMVNSSALSFHNLWQTQICGVWKVELYILGLREYYNDSISRAWIFGGRVKKSLNTPHYKPISSEHSARYSLLHVTRVSRVTSSSSVSQSRLIFPASERKWREVMSGGMWGNAGANGMPGSWMNNDYKRINSSACGTAAATKRSLTRHLDLVSKRATILYPA